MYEYLAEGGERVTVRSVRTLAQLLANGKIVAETPFKASVEPDFVWASLHPQIRDIAEQTGVRLVISPADELQTPSNDALPAPELPTSPATAKVFDNDTTKDQPQEGRKPEASRPSKVDMIQSPWTRKGAILPAESLARQNPAPFRQPFALKYQTPRQSARAQRQPAAFVFGVFFAMIGWVLKALYKLVRGFLLLLWKIYRN